MREFNPKTENFTQFQNISDLQGHIPCAIFTKFSAFVSTFMFSIKSFELRNDFDTTA